MMTAFAGVLTALTGFLIGLNQMGLIGAGKDSTPTPKVSTKASTNNPSTNQSSPRATTVSTDASMTGGLLGGDSSTSGSAAAAAQPTIFIPPTKQPSTSGATTYPVTLASGMQAKAGETIYKILSSKLDQYSATQLALSFKVRYTNIGRYGQNFWGDDFRLIVDDVPIAPEEAPDLVVDGNAAKQGDVLFVIDPTAANIVLQVGQIGGETNTIPISLQPAAP
jgi:hypothetical protein